MTSVKELKAYKFLREKDVKAFREKINEKCSLTEADLEEKIHIDVVL